MSNDKGKKDKIIEDLSTYFKSEVRITLIDKKTGKVVKEEKGSNSLLRYGASDFMSYFDSGINRGLVQYVGIYDSIPSLIKYIVGSWESRESGSNYFQNKLTAIDTSNDAYTAYYFSLNNIIPTDDLSNNVVKHIPYPPVVKGSNQNLRIEWFIRWSYNL